MDCNGAMSQVQHAEKMLLDLPSEFVPPMVCVENESYFVNELLQLRSEEYFIPEHFFFANDLSEALLRAGDYGKEASTGQPELFALGWTATRTAVRDTFRRY